MMWMAWRQIRASVAALYALLAALLLLLLFTGVHLNHLYSAYRGCSGLTCDSTLAQLSRAYPHLNLIGTGLIAAPAVLGMFIGAPLVSRELEHGSFRLAWTQSVSRTRWIATRLAVGALAVALAVGLASFAFSWWSIPWDHTNTTRIEPAIFDQRGIVPVAYAVFAFAMGVTLGAVIRRSLAAMGATLVGFIGVRMLVQFLARPHLLSPLSKVVALDDRSPIGFEITPTGMKLQPGKVDVPHAWVLSEKFADANGHAPTSAFMNHACAAMQAVPPPPPGSRFKGGPSPQMQAAMNACIHNVAARYHEVVSYQPGSHFWALQWIESGIFFGLALVLAALTTFWVRRRLV